MLERDEYFTRYLGYDDVGMFEALARDRGLAWTDRHVTALVARKGTKLQAMLAAGDVLFPGAAAFIRAAAAEVPIAIASGALRHEIVQIIEAAGLERSLRRDRRVGRHAAEQTISRAVSAGVRAAPAGDLRHTRPAALRRDRGFGVGTRIGTWSRVTLCRRDDELCGGRACGRGARRRRAEHAHDLGARSTVRRG